MKPYQLRTVGDRAVSIEFPNEINPEINLRLQALAKIITADKITGIRAVIPAYHTLLVTFSAMVTTPDSLKSRLDQIIADQLAAPLPSKRTLIIPVCYEEPFAPDLADVADYAGISVDEVIQRHTNQSYLIYFLGFLPGFAYMASVDKKNCHAPFI
ncbi:5-oxoprolinase subunit B family protein [Lentilactobacillus kisonensis]|uniref:5-oxoprolinase subunit B family protein n=1 Tax=Lentilactobacillus kisonensis TaxID=481722 RepID=UPI000A5D05ED|nr:carboxyltransferase domain-containing protein [Lentilactobacillus kisonensis]